MGVSGWQGGSLPLELHIEAVICSRHGTHAAYFSAHLKIEIESHNVIIKVIFHFLPWPLQMQASLAKDYHWHIQMYKSSHNPLCQIRTELINL